MARGSVGPSPESVASELSRKGGKLAAVYWVFGPDTLRGQIVIDAIKRRVLGPQPDGLNLDVVTAGAVPGARIADLCRSLPMMAERRLVVVQDPEKLGEGDQEALLRYLQNPSPETVLLMQGRTADLRTRFAKAIGEAGALVKCDELPAWELPGWLAREAERLDVVLGQGVAELLVEVAGTDLGTLRAAVEKLMLYASPRKEIEIADVDAAVAHTRSHEAFELAQAILSRDHLAALRALDRILEAAKSGEEVPLLALVAWQVRQLLRGRDLLAAGKGPREIGEALRVWGERLTPFMRQVRATRGKDLLRAHAALCDADRAMKGGSRRAARDVLEALVLRLCGDVVRARVR